MKFISSFDNQDPFYQPDSSSGIEDVYEKRVDKMGRVTYEKIGEKNVYEEIQMYKDDTDINFIISKCVKDGSVSLLADNGRGSVDVSKLPSDFLSLYNMTLDLQSEFMKLPVEERDLFSQSSLSYVDERINGTAFEKIKKFRADQSAAQSAASAGQSEVNNG